MSGYELANRARGLRPRMKVLYITGYGAGQSMLPPARSAPILAKPVAEEELLARVREALKDPYQSTNGTNARRSGG